MHRSRSPLGRRVSARSLALVAGLVPLGLMAANLPAPTGTPAPADAPLAPAAATPVAPVPTVTAAPANGPLNSLLDSSPYLPPNYQPPQPAAPIQPRTTPLANANLQYRGFSQEGDMTYYVVYDTRTNTSHWLSQTDASWSVPGGAAVQLQGSANNNQTISVNLSGRQQQLDLYKPPTTPLTLPAGTGSPIVIISTDTTNGMGRGGRRGGGGGGPGGGQVGPPVGLTGGGGAQFANGGGRGGNGGGGFGANGGGNGGGGRGANGGNANGGGGFGANGGGGGGRGGAAGGGGGFGANGGGGGGFGGAGAGGGGGGGGGRAGGGGNQGFNTGQGGGGYTGGTTAAGGAGTRRSIVPPTGG